MTHEEQRIALAEWEGWKDIYRCGASLSRTKNGEAHGKRFAGTMDPPSINYGREYQEIPDYLNDLNAVHGLEKKLTDEQTSIYSSYLLQNKSDRPGRGAIYWGIAHATAAQRCEALLKTLNLWKS